MAATEKKSGKAVVLLSGGMDSATVAAMAREQGFSIYALSFRYGQRHAIELEAASHVARQQQARKHLIVDLDPRLFCSALTTDADIPRGRSSSEIAHSGIPATYVPARNTLFLSLALAWAESISASDIFLGIHKLDSSGYPDCRPKYLKAYRKMASLATRTGVTGQAPIRIQAPLIKWDKSRIITEGMRLGVDYGLTTSCYDPLSAGACGVCDACRLRLDGFGKLNLKDPIGYRV